jgi:hypothetical protein
MQLEPMVELAKELGYKPGKNCHLLDNGGKIKL